MVKHRRRTRRRGRGLFDKKKTPPLSEKAYNKLGEQYEHDAYTVIKSIVDQYAAKGGLAEGFSASRVDGMLSKLVDEPRNVDGLRRVELWTVHLLDSKSYSKGQNAFMKEVFDLKHISLL
tara:strand:- start:35 stop:394 length:360 start_codon:yes stop_codon:yes gene_type:complete